MHSFFIGKLHRSQLLRRWPAEHGIRSRRVQGLKKLISAQVAEGKLTHGGGGRVTHSKTNRGSRNVTGEREAGQGAGDDREGGDCGKLASALLRGAAAPSERLPTAASTVHPSFPNFSTKSKIPKFFHVELADDT